MTLQVRSEAISKAAEYANRSNDQNLIYLVCGLRVDDRDIRQAIFGHLQVVGPARIADLLERHESPHWPPLVRQWIAGAEALERGETPRVRPTYEVSDHNAESSIVDMNARPEGESLIEQAVDLDRKMEVIRSLADKNDLEARLELACGLRDPSVRAPLTDEMERIGWRSFLPLLEDVSGVFSRRGDDWPSEFRDWMEEKKREVEQRKKDYQSPHIFDHDQYGIEDT